MKNTLIAAACLLLSISKSQAQQYSTRNAFVGFYSKTSAEDIKAENHQGFAIVDEGKKNLAFAVLVKGFTFPKELMQEHFNENYMESDKYPKATFNGSFTETSGNNVTLKGNLTLHGVTRPLEIPATLQRDGNLLTGHAVFHVSPEDYNISIPSIVREKIQQTLEIHVDIQCDQTK